MKDFGNIKQLLEEKGQIKTKELKDLGYSTYDINQFLTSNLLERKERGLYILKENEYSTTEEKSLTEVDTQKLPLVELCQKGTYELSKKFYHESLKYFEEALKIDPENRYVYHCLSLIAAAKKDFKSSYEYQLKCIKLGSPKDLNKNLLIILALSYLTDVPSEVINQLENQISTDSKTEKYFTKLYSKLKNGNIARCKEIMYYYIKNDIKTRKYHINNHFLDLLFGEILAKENNLEYQEEQSLPSETVIVKEPSEESLVANSLLIDSINSGDYALSREILKSSQITNQDEIIDILLEKLISIQQSLFTKPTKVVQIEPVRIITESALSEEVKQNISKHSTPQKSTIKSISKEVITDETIESLYSKFKENSDNFNFPEARKSLIRYELAYKHSGKSRNIKYHYDRLDINEEEYNLNPEQYKKKVEVINKIKKLISLKEYEEAITLLNEISNINKKDPFPAILMARVFLKLDRVDDAYSILLPYIGICEEPDFFYQMAFTEYKLGNVEKALENCFNYNMRRPKSNYRIYILMADCYKKERKYSKELRALRVAEKICIDLGINIDLNNRLTSAESQANRKHEFILAKINNKDLDYN